MRHPIVAALLAVVSLPLAALDIGDPAPRLEGVTWVKGAAPVMPGPITVVEFWATWCGPCRKTIPHLTSLQKTYGDKLQIAGLSTEEGDTVKPFVTTQGAAMEYRVGLIKEDAAQAYMKDIDGIPHAFLIDAAGTVVWHGHPGTIGGPLSQVMAGNYDVAKAKTLGGLHRELEEATREQQPAIAKLQDIIARIRAVAPFDEKAVELAVSIGRFTKDAAKIRAIMTELQVEGCPAELANSIAWSRATDEELAYRHLDVALALINRAVAKEPASAAFLDTRARILHEIGFFDEAIATEEKAQALDAQDATYGRTLAYFRRLKELRTAGPAGTVPAP